MPVPDLDYTLQRLGEAPIPSDLAMIDDAVIAGLARRRRDAATAPRLMGVAAGIALALGMASGGLSVSEPVAAQTLSPFAPDNPLAPSTLLAVHP
jgi:hypothetical protein